MQLADESIVHRPIVLFVLKRCAWFSTLALTVSPSCCYYWEGQLSPIRPDFVLFLSLMVTIRPTVTLKH